MLEVQIENIIPVTEARDKFNQLVDSVEGSDEMFVLTKNGKPVAILVGVHHLEKLTGEDHEQLFGTSSESTESAPAQPATEDTTTVTQPVAEPAATLEPVIDQSATAAPLDLTIDNVATDVASPAKEVEEFMPPQVVTPPVTTNSEATAVPQSQDQSMVPQEPIETPVVSPSVAPVEEMPPVGQTNNFFNNTANNTVDPIVEESVSAQPQAPVQPADAATVSVNPFGSDDEEELEDPSGNTPVKQ